MNEVAPGENHGKCFVCERSVMMIGKKVPRIVIEHWRANQKCAILVRWIDLS